MIREVVDGLVIKIKIVPNSSKNDIIQEDEFIKVKVTAQPIENKANKALIEYLSKIEQVFITGTKFDLNIPVSLFTVKNNNVWRGN